MYIKKNQSGELGKFLQNLKSKEFISVISCRNDKRNEGIIELYKFGSRTL